MEYRKHHLSVTSKAVAKVSYYLQNHKLFMHSWSAKNSMKLEYIGCTAPRLYNYRKQENSLCPTSM